MEENKNIIENNIGLKKFVEEITKKYKEIKAIWVLNVEKEWLVSLLIDDLKIDEDILKKIKNKVLDTINKIKEEYNLTLHAEIIKLTDYYDAILKNKIDIFAEIKESLCLYDAGGFFKPIKVLVEKGEIKGTKEAIFKLILEVRRDMRELRNIKLDVLSNLYNAIIDAAEAALMLRGISLFVPKEIPKLLEKEFLRKKLISKKTLEAFKDVYNTYKSYEYGEIEEIDGGKLDELIKKTDIFISEMQDLMKKMIKEIK